VLLLPARQIVNARFHFRNGHNPACDTRCVGFHQQHVNLTLLLHVYIRITHSLLPLTDPCARVTLCNPSSRRCRLHLAPVNMEMQLGIKFKSHIIIAATLAALSPSKLLPRAMRSTPI
jgi:hypothetical protein